MSTLHRIYGVSHGDYGFVFRAEDDAALEVLFDPERKYAEMTEIYRACLVAQPTSFKPVINLKTVKALGITIARSILLRADTVIE